jgi:hypothetical protein
METDYKIEVSAKLWPESYPCLICGKPDPYETVSLGYGSQYDGQHVCAECCADIIDPVISVVLNDHVVDGNRMVAHLLNLVHLEIEKQK